MKHEEHHNQAALFQWSDRQKDKHPELSLMYAIPNAARRTPRQGAWMKAEGMKSGVPDICLPVPSGDWHGLYIELKVGKNKPTIKQRIWIEALKTVGYRVEVCYGWEAARGVILGYLSQKEV